MEAVRVIWDDGQPGTVIQRIALAGEASPLVVAFADGSRLRVPEDMLVAQADGTYHLRLDQIAPVNQVGAELVGDKPLVVPVVVEALTVEKRRVARGIVRVRTRVYSKVVEQEVEKQVGLRDETIHVQRRAVDRPVSVSDVNLFKERSFEMTEVHEEAVISKTARVIEEVVMGKEVAEKIETIRETLRRTDVQIEEVPGCGPWMSMWATSGATTPNVWRAAVSPRSGAAPPSAMATA
jgi:stress response protein YsnF